MVSLFDLDGEIGRIVRNSSSLMKLVKENIFIHGRGQEKKGGGGVRGGAFYLSAQNRSCQILCSK